MVWDECSLAQSTGPIGQCSRVVRDGLFSLMRKHERDHGLSAFSVPGTSLSFLIHYCGECSQWPSE